MEEMTIEQKRERYEELYGKPCAPSMKNKGMWLDRKIEEAEVGEAIAIPTRTSPITNVEDEAVKKAIGGVGAAPRGPGIPETNTVAQKEKPKTHWVLLSDGKMFWCANRKSGERSQKASKEQAKAFLKRQG